MFRKLLLIILFLAFAGSALALTAEQAVVDELVRMYGLDTAHYVITVEASRLQATEVAPGEVTLRPITQKEPIGLFTVAADIHRDGAKIESAQVNLRIQRFAEVLVAIDKIDSRELLTADKFELHRVDVTAMYEKPVVSPDEIAGFRATRILRKGTVLTAACMELPPDVEAGRTVSIVYADGFCRVSAPGTALQAGVAGDYVKVKNNASGKIIVARVVDGGAVVVEP